MRFVDAQGAPFPGVVVVPQWHEEQGETSELDGRVALALAPEDDSLEWQVALFARRTGCATRLLRATAVRGQTSDLGDVLLEPGAQVSGRILDTQGLAILGAEVGLAAVELQEEGQDEWDEAYVRRQGGIAFDHTRTVTSDASGAFAFDGAPVGKHRLWAHAEGMRYGWSEPFEVRAGEDLFGVEVRLAALLATDHITGIVLDPAGEPLPRARLMSVSQVGYETSSSTRNVGEDGRFELVLRRDTTYTFVASDPEHRYTDAVLSGVEPGARDVELRLAEKQFFEVFVTDRDERPLELCRFELSAEIGGAVFSDRPEPKVLEPGLFGLGLPPKDFTLVVERDGYLPATFEDLRPGALGARVEVVLERAPRVRGRVVADGKPVAGARVTLHRELAESYFRNGFACLYPVEVESEGTTDAEGRFDLGCRSHGALFVRASAERWVATDLGPVDPAHEQDLRLELTPGGTLEGRVLLPNGADGAGLVVGINRGDGLARTQRAGPGGRFRFDHLMPGRWQVLQRDEELDPSSTTISNFDEPIEIEWSCTVEALRVTRFDLDLTDR
jgi:surface antigen